MFRLALSLSVVGRGKKQSGSNHEKVNLNECKIHTISITFIPTFKGLLNCEIVTGDNLLLRHLL
jgi:hypothetical protein